MNLKLSVKQLDIPTSVIELVKENTLKAVDFVKDSASECAANAVALNLYPTGLLKDKYTGSSHPTYAKNDRPILLVHGILHNHSAFHRLKKSLIEVGMLNVFTINYTTSTGSIHKMTGELEKRVAQVLKTTGASQIDIVAHSLGGIISRHLMTSGPSRGKIRKLISLGTPYKGTSRAQLLKLWPGISVGDDIAKGSYFLRNLQETPLPKGSEILSIASDFDWTAPDSTSFEAMGFPEQAFQNVCYRHLGHTGLLYSNEVFAEVLKGLKSTDLR